MTFTEFKKRIRIREIPPAPGDPYVTKRIGLPEFLAMRYDPLEPGMAERIEERMIAEFYHHLYSLRYADVWKRLHDLRFAIMSAMPPSSDWRAVIGLIDQLASAMELNLNEAPPTG